MKKVHYQNIGLPRTGTSWLHTCLISSLEIGQPSKDLKENPWQETIGLTTLSNSEYINYYKDYDITYNLNPNSYKMSLRQIKNLAEYTTHISIILRNPYDLMHSWYNFWVIHNLEKYNFYKLIHLNPMFNYPDILLRWTQCPLPLKILFYDDLVKDPKKFVLDLSNYIGIHGIFLNLPSQRINEATYTVPMPELRSDIVELINRRIDLISELTYTDLQHWKRDV
jgi:hypothetical protein